MCRTRKCLRARRGVAMWGCCYEPPPLCCVAGRFECELSRRDKGRQRAASGHGRRREDRRRDRADLADWILITDTVLATADRDRLRGPCVVCPILALSLDV